MRTLDEQVIFYFKNHSFEKSSDFLKDLEDFNFSFLPLYRIVRKNTERGDSSPLFSFMEILEEQKIREIAEKAISDDENLFLVEVKVKGNEGNQKVLVFVDGDHGVSIDQCSRVSRQVGEEIEEEDFMKGKYTLEVSSPGLDFPLTLQRQYVKNIGRDLVVEIIDGEKAEGELKEVKDEMIVLDCNGEMRSLKFEEIKQSKVKVSFK